MEFNWLSERKSFTQGTFSKVRDKSGKRKREGKLKKWPPCLLFETFFKNHLKTSRFRRLTEGPVFAC